MFWSRKRFRNNGSASPLPKNEDKTSLVIKDEKKPHLDNSAEPSTPLADDYVHDDKHNLQDQEVDINRNLSWRIPRASSDLKDKSRIENQKAGVSQVRHSASNADDFPCEEIKHDTSSDNNICTNVEISGDRNYEYYLIYCKSCSEYFVDKPEFIGHNKICEFDRKCWKCHEVFKTRSQLFYHIVTENHKVGKHELWKKVSYTKLEQLEAEGKLIVKNQRSKQNIKKKIKKKQISVNMEMDKNDKMIDGCSDNSQNLNSEDGCCKPGIATSSLKDCNNTASSVHPQTFGKALDSLSQKCALKLSDLTMENSVKKKKCHEELPNKSSNDTAEARLEKRLVNIIKCNRCKIYFLRNSSFLNHSTQCSRLKKSHCMLCGKFFKSVYKLHKHVTQSRHSIPIKTVKHMTWSQLKYFISCGRVFKNDTKNLDISEMEEKPSFSSKSKNLTSKTSPMEIKYNVAATSELSPQKHTDGIENLENMIIIDQYVSQSLLDNCDTHEEPLISSLKSVQKEVSPSNSIHEKITPNKSVQEKVTLSKPIQEKVTSSKPVQERVTTSKLVQEKATPNKPVQEIIKPNRPVQEVTPNKPVQDKCTPNKTMQKKITPGKPVQEKATSNKPVQEKVTCSKPIQEKETTSKPVQEKATLSKVQEKITTNKLVWVKATPSKSLQEKATPNKPVQKNTAPGKPVQEKVTTSKPVQDKATCSKPVQEKATPSKLVQEKVTTSKPVQEKVTISNPVQKEATPSKLVQEKVTTSKTVQKTTPSKLIQENIPAKPVQEKVTTSKPVPQKDTPSKLVQEKVTTSKPVQKTTPSKLIQENTTSGKPVQENLTTSKPVQEKATTSKLIQMKVTTSKPVPEKVATSKLIQEEDTTSKEAQEKAVPNKRVQKGITTGILMQGEVLTSKLVQKKVTPSKLMQEKIISSKPVQKATSSKPVQKATPSKPLQKNTPRKPLWKASPSIPVQKEGISSKSIQKYTTSTPVQESVTSSKLVQQRITSSKPVQEMTTYSKPVEEMITSSKPVEEMITSNKPVQEMITSNKPVQEMITSNKPVQEMNTSNKPLQKMITSNKLVQEISSNQPVQEMVTSNKPEQEMIISSKPVQEINISGKPVQEIIISSKPVQKCVSTSKSEMGYVTTSKPVQEVKTSKPVQEKVTYSKQIQDRGSLLTLNTLNRDSLEKKCERISVLPQNDSCVEICKHKQNVYTKTQIVKTNEKGGGGMKWPENMKTLNGTTLQEGPIFPKGDRCQTVYMHHDVDFVNGMNCHDKVTAIPREINDVCNEAVKMTETVDINKETLINERGVKRKKTFDRPMPKSRKIESKVKYYDKCLHQSLHERRSVRLESLTNYCPGCSEFIDVKTLTFNTETFDLSFWCRKCAWDIHFCNVVNSTDS